MHGAMLVGMLSGLPALLDETGDANAKVIVMYGLLIAMHFFILFVHLLNEFYKN